MRILDPILRAGEGRTRRQLERLTAQVNAFEADVAALPDEALAARTAEFRARLGAGESLEDLMPEAFAVVREAARRVLGMRHFDVQVMGGAALHRGNVAQMATGEGKTLVATLPAYLHALSGRGVHVVTVNDYLAARDAAAVGAVHEFLGLSVGVITADLDTAARRAAYACDITYGTNNELGFDYLRDNMASGAHELVQRGHHFAIVDEVDSILIDEARTPLILSGPADDDGRWYAEMARVVAALEEGVHFDVDLKKRTVSVTEAGVAAVEDQLGAGNLYAPEHAALVGYLHQALRASALFARDKDYVVVDGRVLIVDDHTGRVLPDSRYSEGLHQAIEAKEGVPVQPENQTLASITLQNYFRLYDHLAGMTGTADTEAAELASVYGLGVVPIPTNRPNRRVDHPDVIFRTQEAKFAAVVRDVADRHRAGQPVLVGTASVDKSEHLSALLTAAGVPHVVLNAKAHEREAHIVAQAGRVGAVTVATSMAGRGTDIILGGHAVDLARDELAARGLDEHADADAWQAGLPDALERARRSVQAEREQVLACGGLYVLGTERYESRRVDNQLRGRAGRQGDPGESRFYLSVEDDVVARFAGPLLARALDALGVADAPVESATVSRSVASAQASMESQNAQARRDVLKYDDVMSAQREVIYAERRRVLDGHDVTAEVTGMVGDVVRGVVQTWPGHVDDWDLDALLARVRELIPVDLSATELAEAVLAAGTADRDAVIDALESAAARAYQGRAAQVGPERMAGLEAQVLLAVVDHHWRAHLRAMDYLREGIHLRSMAQRDPLVEYQREAYEAFLALMDTIRTETVGYVFHVDFAPKPPGEDLTSSPDPDPAGPGPGDGVRD